MFTLSVKEETISNNRSPYTSIVCPFTSLFLYFIGLLLRYYVSLIFDSFINLPFLCTLVESVQPREPPQP